ncbi:MAG: hypothetical protein P8Y70_06510 [Candidatus Lokiarchaeota archaeon]
MFKNTKLKLTDVQVIFDKLKKAESTDEFKALFNSFLNSARAITNAIQKEGKNINGFEKWYKEKQNEMKSDKLLRFIHESRTVDFHEGKNLFKYPGGKINHFDTSKIGEKPTPNAKLGIFRDGIYWTINEGTSQERRIPVNSGGNYAFYISLENPPMEHLGKKLIKNDPISICQLSIRYYQDLVFEAEKQFT